MKEYLRVGRRMQLVRVTQDPKKLDYLAQAVGGHQPAARADSIEEAVDAATGVGR